MNADEIIANEVKIQNAMWQREEDRPITDNAGGELVLASVSQLIALLDKQHGCTSEEAFGSSGTALQAFYPTGWSGFRDYGSDIANLAVAAAFLRGEIARKLRLGEDTTRAARKPDQKYAVGTVPAVNSSDVA
jgi:hypothetical protein